MLAARSLEEQRAIFESTALGIVVLHDRTIVRCNGRLETVFGYKPGELVGLCAFGMACGKAACCGQQQFGIIRVDQRQPVTQQ